MVLNELRNGGEARPFKAVLTLERETALTPARWRSDQNFTNFIDLHQHTG